MTEKIITKLPDALTSDLTHLVQELQNLGVTHVGHGLIYKDKTPTAYFSVPEWADRYDKEDLVSRDPIRACALQTSYHVIPWDAIATTSPQRGLIEERKKSFHAQSGLLISVKTPLVHETLVLGCDSAQFTLFELLTMPKLMGHYLLRFRAIHSQYYDNGE